MSKVSFRARQIDFNKPLPILKNASDLLTEFNENALVNRGVPQIPSGMEKEEENEHHFVEVIQALQLRTDADIKIPVPDIIDTSVSYKNVYPNGFILPKQLVHIRTVVLAEDEPTDYDMDTEDEEWLSKSELGITPEKFESMIDRLERGCGQKVMNLEEAKYLLQDDPSLVIAVYDYWLNKRVQSRQPLLFSVRQERRDCGSNADPYVAFRRRSEKMQTRKNRKNDEQSYEKMLILRDQMDGLGEILSRLVKREAIKEAVVQCELRSFETRYKLSDWDGTHFIEAENLAKKAYRFSDVANSPKSPKEPPRKRSTRKRKLAQRVLNLAVQNQGSDEASDSEPLDHNPDGPFAFVRTQGCQYMKPRNVSDVSSPQLPNSYPHLRYGLTTVPSLHSSRLTYTGYVRRRLGRGGRIICDRIKPPPDLSTYLRSYDQRLHSSTHLSSSNAETSAHLHARQSEARDEALLRRLRPLVLSSHSCHPSFQWPICTKFSTPPSFEPLYPNPWCLTTEIPPPQSSPCSPLQSAPTSCPSVQVMERCSSPRITASYPTVLEASTKEHLLSVVSDERSTDLDDGSRAKLTKATTTTLKQPTEGLQTNLLSLADNGMVSKSHRLWRKLARLDSMQPPDFPRSRGGEAPIHNANGLDPRILQSSDDRLLLTDPSVLSAPKTCSLARDCVSRDPSVPGPQLQTANGVSPTQFCQLPT